MLIQSLSFQMLEILRKIQRLSIRDRDAPEPRPKGTDRKDLVGSLDISRDDRTTGLIHDHADPWFSRPQFPGRRSGSFGKDDDRSPVSDVFRRLGKRDPIQPTDPQRNPSERLQDLIQKRNREQIMPPEKPDPPEDSAAQERNIQKACMVRRNQQAPFARNTPLRPVPETD
jgi:hypothetical protein